MAIRAYCLSHAAELFRAAPERKAFGVNRYVVATQQEIPTRFARGHLGRTVGWCNGECNGRPMLARIHQGLAPLADTDRYPLEVTISVKFHEASASGLPSDREIEDLNVIGDSLAEMLERDHAAVHALTITTDGVREFIFYASNEATVEAGIVDVSTRIRSHDFKYSIEREPWTLYRKLTSE